MHTLATMGTVKCLNCSGKYPLILLTFVLGYGHGDRGCPTRMRLRRLQLHTGPWVPHALATVRRGRPAVGRHNVRHNAIGGPNMIRPRPVYRGFDRGQEIRGAMVDPDYCPPRGRR